MPRDENQPPPPPVGAWVRTIGEQYPEARRGTALVIGHHIVSGGHIEVDVITRKGRITHWAETATVECHPYIASRRLNLALVTLDDPDGSWQAGCGFLLGKKGTGALHRIFTIARNEALHRETGLHSPAGMANERWEPLDIWGGYYNQLITETLPLADAISGYTRGDL